MLKKIVPIFPILAGILWGATGIFIRKSTELSMNNITIVSSKAVTASVIMFVSIFLYNKSLIKIHLKDIFIFISAALIGMLGVNIFFNESVSFLSLSLAAVLLSLSPIFVLLLSYFLYKEKITLKKLISIILAFVGCILVSNILKSEIKISLWGVISGLLAAFSYALYSIISKKAMLKGYHSLTITLYAFIFIAVITAPLADWNLIVDLIKKDNNIFIFIILHSLLVLILPYVFYTVSLNYMDTGKASILASCEPIAASVFGIIFFNEIPNIFSVIGIILTITALTLLSINTNKN
ncbi:DMT family transporter [Brachyspira innocens]|uniref:DMT family transporter n=1 Tax=Brachyspira innocens TaxID=13264 RepID=A0ABT8YV44_9SPIR|nr:DMT family transporter [Brachyspira innocens]MDO6994708.1 DMT family transporter [Brachyspira innocens]MDO7019350.1 DMT family transporter [Brachyspira innocens]